MNRQDDLLRTDAVGTAVDHMHVALVHIPAAKAVAADTDAILDGVALPAAAGAVTTFLAQPPWPLNVTAVCSGTQTGKATIEGLDFNGDPIEEELTLNSTTPVVGAKAFRTITKINLPIKAGSETIDVGWGGKFGLPYKLHADELVFVKLFNKAADTGTVAISETELASNTFDVNGTPDGLKQIDLYVLI